MTRKARTRAALRRRRPKFVPRQSVLIVCEGAKTEPNYFDGLRRHLRLSPVEVVVVGEECGSDPVSVVREAKKRRKDRIAEAKTSDVLVPFDVVWCVMDVERYRNNPRLPEALGLAQSAKIKAALSNPCFEYWLLLHFGRVGHSFGTCAAVISELKAHIVGYRKGDPHLFLDFFAERIPVAVQNAADILRTQWQTENDRLRRDPSTEVHLLIELLQVIGVKAY